MRAVPLSIFLLRRGRVRSVGTMGTDDSECIGTGQMQSWSYSPFMTLEQKAIARGVR
jgi:hypothetical protein